MELEADTNIQSVPCVVCKVLIKGLVASKGIILSCCKYLKGNTPFTSLRNKCIYYIIARENTKVYSASQFFLVNHFLLFLWYFYSLSCCWIYTHFVWYMPDFKECLYNPGDEMRSVCILCLLKYEINLKMCYLGGMLKESVSRNNWFKYSIKHHSIY